MKESLEFILQLLTIPALLITILVKIGLLIGKRKKHDIIEIGINTFIGLIMILVGMQFIQTILGDLDNMLINIFKINNLNYTFKMLIDLATGDFLLHTVLIIVLGYIFNIILVKFSQLKYLFMSGYQTIILAALIECILLSAKFNDFTLVLTSSLLLGLLMALMPFLAKRIMPKTSEKVEFGLGDFGVIVYALSSFMAEKVGKNSKSIDEIAISFKYEMFNDYQVLATLLVLIISLIINMLGIFISPSSLTNAYNINFFWYIFMESAIFAIALSLILKGCELSISHIIEGFKAISEKFLPKAIMAIDNVFILHFSLKASLIGFVLSFVGGIVGLLLTLLLIQFNINVSINIPSLLLYFFSGAVVGVICNSNGGYKGLIVGSLIHGLIINLLGAFLVPLLAGIGFVSTNISTSDMMIVGIMLGNLSIYINEFGIMFMILVLYLSPIGYGYMIKRKNNEKHAKKKHLNKADNKIMMILSDEDFDDDIDNMEDEKEEE